MDWTVLFSTFGLVFVAELGDKTQLAVLTQTCKYRRPWAVFLGASLALTAVTALGVVGGQVLGRIIPEPALRSVAALAFVTMGVLIGREAAKAQADEPARGMSCDCVGDNGEEVSSVLAPAWDWRAFGSTFGLLFVAEMGDKTQLAVFSCKARARPLSGPSPEDEAAREPPGEKPRVPCRLVAAVPRPHALRGCPSAVLPACSRCAVCAVGVR